MGRDRLSPKCCCFVCKELIEDLSALDTEDHPDGWTVTGVDAGIWAIGDTATIPTSYFGSSREAFSIRLRLTTGSFRVTIQGIEIEIDLAAGTISVDDGTTVHESIFRPEGERVGSIDPEAPDEGSTVDPYRDLVVYITPDWFSVYVHDSQYVPLDGFRDLTPGAQNPGSGFGSPRGSVQLIDRENSKESGFAIESLESDSRLYDVTIKNHDRKFQAGYDGELVSECYPEPGVPCTERTHQMLRVVSSQNQLGGITYEADFYSLDVGPPVSLVLEANPEVAGYDVEVIEGYTDQGEFCRVFGGISAVDDDSIASGGGNYSWYRFLCYNGTFTAPSAQTPYPKPSRIVRADGQSTWEWLQSGFFVPLQTYRFHRFGETELEVEFQSDSRAPGTIILTVGQPSQDFLDSVNGVGRSESDNLYEDQVRADGFELTWVME